MFKAPYVIDGPNVAEIPQFDIEKSANMPRSESGSTTPANFTAEAMNKIIIDRPL